MLSSPHTARLVTGTARSLKWLPLVDIHALFILSFPLDIHVLLVLWFPLDIHVMFIARYNMENFLAVSYGWISEGKRICNVFRLRCFPFWRTTHEKRHRSLSSTWMDGRSPCFVAGWFFGILALALILLPVGFYVQDVENFVFSHTTVVTTTYLCRFCKRVAEGMAMREGAMGRQHGDRCSP